MSPKQVLPFFLALFFFALPAALTAQNPPAAGAPRGHELFFGYGFLSNSFNGHSTYASHTPLNGWNAAFAIPVKPHVSVKIDATGYYGTSLGSPQHPIFLLGGAQYSHRFGKETGFAEGLAGYGHLNSDWWGGLAHGSTSTFAASAGAGLDTPLSRRLAFRVQGGLLFADFTIPDNQIRGLPRYFARISTGLVWSF